MEGRPLAQLVIDILVKNQFSPLPWFDFFNNLRPPLQELENLTLRADAAILIATADDKSIIRKKKWHQMRDNVLFEYGLFAGAIGRNKCGLILPENEDFRIPSDFLGVACFETYQENSIVEAASITVQALSATLGKPQPDETKEIRGRRLLSFLGWIRDEALLLVQNWGNDKGKELIAGRIIAISGFLKEDISYFKLHNEYEAVESAMLESVQHYPDLGTGNSFDYDEQIAIKALFAGSTPRKYEVMHGLLGAFHRYGLKFYGQCECKTYWEKLYPHLTVSGKLREHNLYILSSGGQVGYASGAADAAGFFEKKYYSAISQLNTWSKEFITPLNNAVVQFERKLHEQIFGKL